MPQRVTALTVGMGIVVWLLLVYVSVVTWDEFVKATGDTLDECERHLRRVGRIHG